MTRDSKRGGQGVGATDREFEIAGVRFREEDVKSITIERDGKTITIAEKDDRRIGFHQGGSHDDHG